MNIDSQIAAVRAAQGTLAIERRMLGEAFAGPPAPTSSPGVNATKRLVLSDGAVVFHKPFSDVRVANALAYGQTAETPPLHDAVGWDSPPRLLHLSENASLEHKILDVFVTLRSDQLVNRVPLTPIISSMR